MVWRMGVVGSNGFLSIQNSTLVKQEAKVAVQRHEIASGGQIKGQESVTSNDVQKMASGFSGCELLKYDTIPNHSLTPGDVLNGKGRLIEESSNQALIDSTYECSIGRNLIIKWYLLS